MKRWKGKSDAGKFSEFERALNKQFEQAKRKVMKEVMSASDIDADALEIDGHVYRRVLKSQQRYMAMAGEVAVERWLYKDRSDPTAHALAGMDLKLGIVEGFWTREAVQQASWVMTQMTPQKAQELFKRMRGMSPSKAVWLGFPSA